MADIKDRAREYFTEQKTKELKAQNEKMRCALNKIIKTVQNDNISGYGDRLVIIYDISCDVLQEIKEND
jgi:Txe/YoeB family toxin of Txe-Axe toxin-antitoxin module